MRLNIIANKGDEQITSAAIVCG